MELQITKRTKTVGGRDLVAKGRRKMRNSVLNVKF